MNVNPGEEHDVKDDDGYNGSCCGIDKASTLVKSMESGTNTLLDYGALFLWDLKLE